MIARYKAEEYPLTYRELSSGTQVPGLKIGDLVRGVSYEVKDVTTLLKNEDIIKEACKKCKTLLVVMASLGGKEVIEF